MTSYETVQDSETTLHRQFEVDRPVRVEVENHSGDIAVETGQVGRLEVDAVCAAGREVLDRVRIDLDGDVLKVSAPRTRRRWFGGGADVSFRIVVPAGSGVTGETESGELTLVGPLGAAELRTASGGVSVDTAVTAVVTSASGDVRIGSIDGDCRVSSASGDVEIAESGGRVRVDTASGDTEIGSVAGPVEVSTASGDIEVSDVGGEVRARTMSGDVRIRRATGGRVQATTASGDIEIGIPESVTAWLDLTSASGDVESELTGSGEPEPGAPTIEIRAITASGDIRIRRG